jgi:septum formation inhibitor MinC
MQKENLQNKALIISSQKQPLNKEQQAFNKLVKQIEKLRLETQKVTVVLDDKLKYYSEHLHPLEQDLTEIDKELLLCYFDIYSNQKFLTKNEKGTLKQLIVQELESHFKMTENPDEALKKMFEQTTGKSFDKLAEEGFEEMKKEMGSMFESFGFDMDLSNMHKDMSQEEIARTMAEMQSAYQEKITESEQNRQQRRKTPRQLQQEEKERLMEEARSKNISSIYRQLAKAYHPDLEQDEMRKAEKEILMKQLTIAYENKDLHTLLRLELDWIHKEEERATELTGEKLKIYNAVLKEQVQELKQEIHMIKMHPRYQPISKYMDWFEEDIVRINLYLKKDLLNNDLNFMKKSITTLKGPGALKEIKEIITQFKHRQKKQPFDNMLDEMFAEFF